MQKIFRRAIVVVPCIGFRNFPPSTQSRIANHPVFACVDKRRCLHLDPFNDPIMDHIWRIVEMADLLEIEERVDPDIDTAFQPCSGALSRLKKTSPRCSLILSAVSL
ncbi:hypothetical protein CO671_31815 [Rhizobium sp. M10]|nr:hypothetical protein CO671_31815 [Rhizobium sp. M10]